MLRKAELIDAQEDQRYGKSKSGEELPKELQLRQDRLDALRKARAELEAAADNARRREQQARAAEEQSAEAAVQDADAEAAAADNDKSAAE